MTTDSHQTMIEKDFKESWDVVERTITVLFSGECWETFRNTALSLFAEMRAKGYDKHFRAGTSLNTFVISRSRQHGLRPEQPRLGIDLGRDGKMSVIYYESGTILKKIEFDGAGLMPELEELFQRLLQHPID